VSPKIIIIGGGIGGTAAALALLRASFDVRVYEQVAAKTEVGAGIQLSPNATRLLQRYGLGEALKLRGVRPDAIEGPQVAGRRDALARAAGRYDRAIVWRALLSHPSRRPVVRAEQRAPGGRAADGSALHGRDPD
jgi:2-polyprenyl-6-methoxyphenol hydroxylase-like FAD-dependent oxidoreductase